MQRRSLTGTDAILFDLDGTLWDSAPSVSGSWQRALQRFAPELRPPITADEVRSCMGMRIDELGCRLFPMLDDDARAELLSQCLMEEDAALRQEGGILFPAVPETLAELHKTYKLCVVSNCQYGYIEFSASFRTGESLSRPYLFWRYRAFKRGKCTSDYPA